MLTSFEREHRQQTAVICWNQNRSEDAVCKVATILYSLSAHPASHYAPLEEFGESLVLIPFIIIV